MEHIRIPSQARLPRCPQAGLSSGVVGTGRAVNTSSIGDGNLAHAQLRGLLDHLFGEGRTSEEAEGAAGMEFDEWHLAFL